MATFSLCAARLPPSSQPVLGSHRPSLHLLKPIPKLPSIPLPFRFKNAVRLQTRPRLFTAIASNSNPSGGDSRQEKSNGTKSIDAGQDPPFLTILAGLVVFFLICWLGGSIVISLFGVVAKLLSPK